MGLDGGDDALGLSQGAPGRACLRLRRNIEYLRYCGINVETMGLTTRSSNWQRLVATITGCRCIATQVSAAAALGAALLAGMACGRIRDVREAEEVVLRGARETDPEPGLNEAYEAAYRQYWKIEEAFAGAGK